MTYQPALIYLISWENLRYDRQCINGLSQVWKVFRFVVMNARTQTTTQHISMDMCISFSIPFGWRTHTNTIFRTNTRREQIEAIKSDATLNGSSLLCGDIVQCNAVQWRVVCVWREHFDHLLKSLLLAKISYKVRLARFVLSVRIIPYQITTEYQFCFFFCENVHRDFVR